MCNQFPSLCPFKAVKATVLFALSFSLHDSFPPGVRSIFTASVTPHADSPPPMFASSPPVESLPPPVFDDNTTMIHRSASETSHGGSSTWQEPGPLDTRCSSEEPVLPLTPKRVKFFKATVVSTSSGDSAPVLNLRLKCPRWSEWATSQFAFDYLFALITSSTASEL
jgi:hypothetical protein